MKKNVFRSLTVISILTFILCIGARPPESKNVSLRDIRYSQSSLVIRFDVTGFHKLSEIQGSVIVDGQFTQLKCKFVNSHTVIKCLAKSMNRYEGQNARIWLSGFTFYTQVPFK